MIPRIVHQFWAGEEPMPDCSSWDIEGWEHVIWSLDSLPRWFLPTEQWLDPEAFTLPFNHPRERLFANIIRFELLAELGGVWADCDMELVGDLEELLVGDCNVARFGGRIGTGFIASRQHHPFIDSCRGSLRSLDHRQAVPSMWAAERAPVDRVTFLDPTLVYPNGYWESDPQGFPLVLNNRPRCPGETASGEPCGCQ